MHSHEHHSPLSMLPTDMTIALAMMSFDVTQPCKVGSRVDALAFDRQLVVEL
ncbi:hypothetical protein EWM64_g10290 [Hericium alpestre]|uniref:Uncharacterized protein n=1 Tax=Hericium alpestre TaxID=135208 RepID=A0A4Y9ZGJ3_9AGAM|nr:hypothetical protein EWM64_g10290 [Hericium alpestre]